MLSHNDYSNDTSTEVLFQTWALKLCGLEKKSLFKFTKWSKRYFRIIRNTENKFRLIYSHSEFPYVNGNLDTNNEDKNIIFELENGYQIQKYMENLNGKLNNLIITTPTKKLILSFESGIILHLFSFYMLTNYRLIDLFEDQCYKVRPENSQEHNNIGSRGSLCQIHVSEAGIILVLEVSKALLAYWPIVHIKSFETRGRNQFILHVGKHSMTGEGSFLFSTRSAVNLNFNDAIYDLLHGTIERSTTFKKKKPVSLTSDLLLNFQLSNLQTILTMAADSSFDNYLRKISRNIYDKFLEHTGTNNFISASSSMNNIRIEQNMNTVLSQSTSRNVVPIDSQKERREITLNQEGAIYIHDEYLRSRQTETVEDDKKNCYTSTPRQSQNNCEEKSPERRSTIYASMSFGDDSYDLPEFPKSTLC